jgi:hypothetical protein
MRALEREWDSLLRNPPREEPLSKKGKLIKAQRDLLRKNLSTDDMRHLAATCGMLPIHEPNPNEFKINALQFIVARFIESGDQENLVTLLSARFPDWVGPECPTGYYLIHCPSNMLRNPVLVLGEAYSRCNVPEVRRDIAKTVRSGFAGFDIPGKNDDEFVRNAMQWYEKHKGRLMLREDFTGAHPESFFQWKVEKTE